jgi:hypothetical protein
LISVKLIFIVSFLVLTGFCLLFSAITRAHPIWMQEEHWLNLDGGIICSDEVSSCVFLVPQSKVKHGNFKKTAIATSNSPPPWIISIYIYICVCVFVCVLLWHPLRISRSLIVYYTSCLIFNFPCFLLYIHISSLTSHPRVLIMNHRL